MHIQRRLANFTILISLIIVSSFRALPMSAQPTPSTAAKMSAEQAREENAYTLGRASFPMGISSPLLRRADTGLSQSWRHLSQ